ncbi:hypothetical protein CDL12_02526 [Handroanthus impetiginosus]|uniref:Uncharacterized protein n=1 Tax=Handroanthus impetiginosus TaxID=429701 RepID=A0A2G9I4P5_9LAMI|nr:hypothetical protein CDL12_02526 [Handroanthus impetiginosus]
MNSINFVISFRYSGFAHGLPPGFSLNSRGFFHLYLVSSLCQRFFSGFYI